MSYCCSCENIPTLGEYLQVLCLFLMIFPFLLRIVCFFNVHKEAKEGGCNLRSIRNLQCLPSYNMVHVSLL